MFNLTLHQSQHSSDLLHNGLVTSRLRRDGMTILHNPRSGWVGNGARVVFLGTESVWYRRLSVRERVALCQGLSDLLGLTPPDPSRLGDDRGECVDIRYDQRAGWVAIAREV